ncbi:class I SAM-dependent methyltransferase [Halorhodospira halochloris]|uniref:class I SAM-dependent methyltransferase n=1 Tax=Halorhodospira halochloris TaxID=1052 RepID=UPI001EE97A97|nr:class I SAM-dependent methyltransferase [Halorhodospira halochloris]
MRQYLFLESQKIAMPLWELAVIGLALLAIASVAFYTVVTGTAPMPSSAAARDQMVAMLSEPRSGDIVDVGCGTGTLLFALAERFPTAQVTGYERSPLPYCIARLRLFAGKLRGKYQNVTIIWDDFRRRSLVGSGAVFCYLDRRSMQQLGEQLAEQLASGALVISNAFAIPNWRPLRVCRIAGNSALPIYLYRVQSQ